MTDHARDPDMAEACAAFAELLVAFDEHLLAPDERGPVEDHLENCEACRNRLAQLHLLRARLTVAGESFRASTADAVMARIRGPVGGGASPAPGAARRRWLMPRPARFAAVIAASAAIVSTGFFLWPAGGSAGAAFAGVVSKAREARAVRFHMYLLKDGEKLRERVMMFSDARVRVETPDHRVSIGDFDRGQSLVLHTDTRTFEHEAADASHRFNPYHLLIGVKDLVAQNLGVEMYEGRPVRVFRAVMPDEMRALHGDAQLTVWADLATSLPVRLEVQHAPTDARLGDVLMVVDQFDFGPIDEKLFSLDPPAGYTLTEPQPPAP